MQDVSGETSAAKKNRETEARLHIIGALQRLGISFDQWPDFVREFYSDEFQPIQYHALMTPAPFQAPEFDRLNQSPKDWVNVADRAWELHRQKFLQECQAWVRDGRGRANRAGEARPRYWKERARPRGRPETWG